MSKYVVNPLTNRRILVGGTTYNKLVLDGTLEFNSTPKPKSNSRRKVNSSVKRSSNKSDNNQDPYIITYTRNGEYIMQDPVINRSMSLYIDKDELKYHKNLIYPSKKTIQILNSFKKDNPKLKNYYYTREQLEDLDLFSVDFTQNDLVLLIPYPFNIIDTAYNGNSVGANPKFSPGA